MTSLTSSLTTDTNPTLTTMSDMVDKEARQAIKRLQDHVRNLRHELDKVIEKAAESEKRLEEVIGEIENLKKQHKLSETES